MLESIQTFIESMRAREHVKLLIAETDLTICFISKENATMMVMKKGEVDIIKEVNHESAIEISGDEGAIKALLRGRETLRALVKKELLEVSIPFRTILLLESLFYLAKKDEQQSKII